MKRSISGKPLACVIALVFACSAQAANPVVYRGVLSDAGAPANGRYDLQFSVRDEAKGAVLGPFVLTDVQVTDGAFAVNLPLDAELLPKSGRMEIAVRDPKIGGSFEMLPDAQPFSTDAVAGAACSGTWDTFGNAGLGVGNFLGTTDAAALEIRVNNTRAMLVDSAQVAVTGDVALSREVDRAIAVASEPNNNTGGRTLTVRAGSTFSTGALAQPGGNLILQAGQGYNASISGADGGDVIIRSGGNHIDGIDDGGDIVFEVGVANGGFTERARLLEAGQFRLPVLGIAGATTLCRNASNEIATCSSSKRYKNDIVDTSLGLDTVAKLRAVDFTWKADGSADVGLVAEEVAEISSRLVTFNADGAIEGVRYDRLAAVLVNAMQEQQAQIATLQRKLADQERQQDAAIQVLMQRVDALQRAPTAIVAGAGETP